MSVPMGRRRCWSRSSCNTAPTSEPIRFKGDAKLSFGAKPELVATLSAPQIDLDRILALPEPAGRHPLVAIRDLAESFVRVASACRWP